MARVSTAARRAAGDAVVLVPAVVVDEVRSGAREEYAAVPGLYEEFFAVSARRQYQHALGPLLLEQAATVALGGPG